MLRRILNASRFMLALPVVGSLLLAAGVVIMGIGVIVTSSVKLFNEGEFSVKAAKKMSVAVIETIDLFLVGAVAYITAVGLYKLFITDDDIIILRRIVIENLTDLETKIIGVVIAALSVAFLGEVAFAESPTTLLYMGAGTALVIASLVFFLKMNKDGKK